MVKVAKNFVAHVAAIKNRFAIGETRIAFHRTSQSNAGGFLRIAELSVYADDPRHRLAGVLLLVVVDGVCRVYAAHNTRHMGGAFARWSTVGDSPRGEPVSFLSTHTAGLNECTVTVSRVPG